MRTELLAAALLSGWTLSGCALTSVRGDLDRIGALAGVEVPSSLARDATLEDDEDPEAWLTAPLTAERAVTRALVGNRTLRAELRELGIDRGRLVTAGLLPNPHAEFDLRQPDDGAQPLQVELFLEIALTESLLTPLRVEAARRDLDAARFRVAGSVVRTIYRVREAFYRAQAAERRWRVATRSLEALAAARDAAEMIYASGNAPALDRATQIAAYEEARLTVASLELERAQRREALNVLLGLSGPATGWEIALEIDVPTARAHDELEREAIEHSLELAELRERADAAGSRSYLSRLEGWLPEVSVDVHAEADGPGWEVGGGASFSVPLFDHAEGRTAVHAAELDGLLERYEGTAIALRSEARFITAATETARERVRHYQDVVLPAWDAVVEETRLQYDAMQVGIFQLVAALRARLAAELGAVTAMEELLIAEAARDALVRGARVTMTSTAAPTMDASPEGGH
jgi:outer membrane protein TolC